MVQQGEAEDEFASDFCLLVTKSPKIKKKRGSPSFFQEQSIPFSGTGLDFLRVTEKSNWQSILFPEQSIPFSGAGLDFLRVTEKSKSSPSFFRGQSIPFSGAGLDFLDTASSNTW